MAKLPTHVDNIQIKSNLVDADLPSEEWSQSQYPSARTLYKAFDAIHPVGSVMCMSEQKNPADLLGLGTWTLIDKELTPTCIQLTSSQGWTDINGYLTTANNEYTSKVHIAGHSVTLQLFIKLHTAMASDNTFDLGTINPSAVGISEFPATKLGIPVTVDGGEVVANATIKLNGEVNLADGWSVTSGTIKHEIGLDYWIPIHASYTIPTSLMLDDFCNKFYYKRIA